MDDGRWEASAAATSIVAAWLAVLTVLSVGAGLAVHASGVFTLPIPEVEGAAQGSYLLWRQSVLATVPAWLTPLAFVAVTFVLTGIGLTLARILRTIRVRATATEQALPALIEGRNQR